MGAGHTHVPTMWTLIKWLPWQQQLERSGSSSGIDRGAGVELTPAGGTRTEGGTQDPHPSMTPFLGHMVCSKHLRRSHQRHKVAATLRAGSGHTRNTGAIYPDSPPRQMPCRALSHTSAGNQGTHACRHAHARTSLYSILHPQWRPIPHWDLVG